MKAIVSIFLFVICSLCVIAQDRPDWVRQRPVNTMYYIGIARVEKSEKDYMEKAKSRALRDLISEIKVNVSAHSLLSTLEQNGMVKSDYKEIIQTESSEKIEKYELVDSWQNEKEYWVYYQLNKFDYEDYITQRREKAIRNGFDFWYKGEVALQQGNLMTALELWLQGLEVVQEVANEELTCQYNGQTIDIGRELYTSLKSVFDGVQINVDPGILEGKAFQGIDSPVVVRVKHNGTPLKNLGLKYEFITGEGQITGNIPTDEKGETSFYVRNVTSKLAEQEIAVTLDPSFFGRFKQGIYKKFLEDLLSVIPRNVVYIRMGQTQLNAYIVPEKDSDVRLQQAVQRVLTNNFFNMVSAPAEADVLVGIKSDFRKGETTAGDMRDFVTYYAGIQINLKNNRNGQILTDFTLENVKILQPSTASESTAKSAAVRELTKRLQRELSKILAGLNISREGERNPHLQVREETVVPETDEKPEGKVKVDPDVKPIIVVIDRTPSAPVVSEVPEKKIIEGELLPDFFIRYVGMKKLGDRCVLTFSAINQTKDDRELYLARHRVKVINEKGEEVRMLRMQIGSSGYSDWARALVVVNLPTAIVFEMKPMEKAELVQIEDTEGHIVKLRNVQ